MLLIVCNLILHAWDAASVVPEFDSCVGLSWVVLEAPWVLLVKELDLSFKTEVGNHNIWVDRDHVDWAVAGDRFSILIDHLLHHFEELFNACPVKRPPTLDCHWIPHDAAANLAHNMLRLDQLFLGRQRLFIKDALNCEVKLIGIYSVMFVHLARDVKFVKSSLLCLQRGHEIEGNFAIDLEVLE